MAKPTCNGRVVAKVKEMEKMKELRKETKKVLPRPQSTMSSPLPVSPEMKSACVPKWWLSVVIPFMSKEYFLS